MGTEELEEDMLKVGLGVNGGDCEDTVRGAASERSNLVSNTSLSNVCCSLLRVAMAWNVSTVQQSNGTLNRSYAISCSPSDYRAQGRHKNDK